MNRSIALWPARAALIASTVALLGACGDDDTPAPTDTALDGAGDAGSDSGSGDAADPDAAPDGDSDGSADAGASWDPRFDPLMEAVAADVQASLATGASVAIWLDDQIIWVGGVGSSDGDGTGVITEDTLFMIGSDTKKITAISLLRQVEAGRATVDTRIEEVLTGFVMERAPDFPRATVHQLLSHQGGIVDGTDDTRSTTDDQLASFAWGEFARSYYQLAPPGTFWNYSNPNFSIAGLLDETLAAEPWADAVTRGVFIPLQMDRTFARKAEILDDPDVATGFGLDAQTDTTNGPVSLEDTWEGAFVRPAGLVWSTPSDQMKLARFLVDGDPAVLSDTLRQAISADQVDIYPDLPGSYGYGLFSGRGIQLGPDSWYDVAVWNHGGNTITHTSTFYILPEQRFAISILSNGLGDDFTQSLVAAVSTLVDLPEPTIQPEMPFDATVIDSLLGSYMDDNNAGELIFTRDGDTLRLDAPRLDFLNIPYEPTLTPLSSYVWIANIQEQELDVTFNPGPDGRMWLHNRAFAAVREADGEPLTRLDLRPMPNPDALRTRLRMAAADWTQRRLTLPSP
jgi:CubicO group peptidase (beta-lactamase class C family)